MIGKIKNLPARDHLARLAAYLSGPQAQRVAGFFPINLAADNLDHAVTLVDAQAGLSRRARKPVAHVSVSYSPRDSVTTAQMYADAQRVLLALGAEQSQAFVVVHDDKPYRHFHVVYNRVGTDGRCISSSNTKRKIESILRKLEKERGLRVVQGRLAPAEPSAAAGSNEGNRFKGPPAARRGYVQPPAEVVSVMREGQSREEIDARLEQLGWRLDEARPKPGQKSGGLVLRGPAGVLSRASDCGRDCSGPALARRFSATAVAPKPNVELVPPSPAPAQRGYIQPPPEVALAMSQAQSRPELDAWLAKLGWVLVKARPKPGQKAGGLVLRGPAGVLARASDCGRESSGPALARRFAAVASAAHFGREETKSAPPVPLPTAKRGEALAKALRSARSKPKPRGTARPAGTPTAIPIIRKLTTLPEL
jgi:hypothetical protein